MATPEAKVKAQIKKLLDTTHCYWFMPVTGGFGKAGVADFAVCANGRYVAVEAKAGKGKTTALQDREADRVRAAGGISLVINETNLHELQNTLELINARATTT